MINAEQKLPAGWKWIKLGEVCEVIAGQSPPGTTYRKEPQGLPFFQGKADFAELHPVARTWCVAPKKVALPGDILLSVRAPVGPTNVADIECCIGRGLAAIRCTKLTDRVFILYFFRLYEDKITRMGTGSTFQSINRNDIENLEIPLPPTVQEQKRIAGILADQMAAAAKAKEACQQKLEAAEKLPASYLNATFNSDKAKQWPKKKLVEVCKINPKRPSDLKAKPQQNVTFVPMPAVDANEGIINKPEIKQFREVRKGYTYFEENDVLFAKITPCMQNGKHSIARNLINGFGFGTTEFHVIKPLEHILPEWIHSYIRQPHILHEAEHAFTGAVGQQRVPKDFLKTLEIPLPSLVEQKRIAEILTKQMSAAEKVKKAIEEELKLINKLPASLLQQAFGGEL